MEQFNKKVKSIFIPFLIISIATIGIYTFLHWLLCVKTHIISVDQDIVNFLIPILIPGIPIFLCLRPRIKLLDLTVYQKSSRAGTPLANYILFAWLGVAFPIAITQQYLDSKTGTLTQLNYISEITTVPVTKYYKVRNFYLNKKLLRTRRTYDIRGNQDQYYDMTFYTPCPFYNNSDTSRGPIAWLAVAFKKEISNRLSNEEKNTAYGDFAVKSAQKLIDTPIDRFVYLERLESGTLLPRYLKAINRSVYPALKQPVIVLSPIFETYEARNGNKLFWAITSFIAGALVFLSLLTLRSFKKEI